MVEARPRKGEGSNTEEILNTIAQNELIDAMETVDQAGDFAIFIAKVADFISNHIWLIPVILIIAAIIRFLLKSYKK